MTWAPIGWRPLHPNVDDAIGRGRFEWMTRWEPDGAEGLVRTGEYVFCDTIGCGHVPGIAFDLPTHVDELGNLVVEARAICPNCWTTGPVVNG